MANTIQLSKMYKDYLQENLYKELVGMKVAETRTAANLYKGKTMDWFTMDKLTVTPYVVGTDVTLQNVVMGTDTLTINKQYESSATIDLIEETQANVPLISAVSMEQAKAIAQRMDTDILANVTVAPADVNCFDEGDYNTGTSTGVALAVTDTNIIQVLSKIRAKLGKRGAVGTLAAVVTYDVASAIEIKAATTGFSVADASLRNGFAGKWMGYEIYVSDNLDQTTDARKHCYVGLPGMISLGTQIAPRTEMSDIPMQFGQIVKTLAVYGTKVFARNRERFLDLHVA